MWRLLRRIGAAASVLFLPGDRTPVTRADLADIRREHTEWVRDLTDILEKLNAWHARQGKRIKRELQAELAGASAPTAAPPSANRKLSLYRRAQALTQGSLALEVPNAPPPPPDEDDEP